MVAEYCSGGGFDKDVERVDAPVLEVGDVHAVDGHRAVWRSSLPAQSADAMMAEGQSGRRLASSLVTASEIAA